MQLLQCAVEVLVELHHFSRLKQRLEIYPRSLVGGEINRIDRLRVVARIRQALEIGRKEEEARAIVGSSDVRYPEILELRLKIEIRAGVFQFAMGAIASIVIEGEEELANAGL